MRNSFLMNRQRVSQTILHSICCSLASVVCCRLDATESTGFTPDFNVVVEAAQDLHRKVHKSKYCTHSQVCTADLISAMRGKVVECGR